MLINNGSDHIRIIRCESYNAPVQGCLDRSDTSAGFNEFIDSIFHDNGSDPNLDHGLYVQSTDATVTGCTFYNNIGLGLQHFKNGGNALRGIITRNRSYDNGATNGKAGILVAGNNTFTANNISYRNGGDGILIWDHDDQLCYNNTCYDNGDRGIDIDDKCRRATVQNNICFSNTGGEIRDQTTDSTVSDNTTTNPTFTDPANGDFTIGPGSAAEDAGLNLYSAGVIEDFDGNPRPQAGPFDNGAYEI